MALPAGPVKRLGRSCGFDLVRVSRAEAMLEESVRYLEWVAAGRQGSMSWITPERAARSTDPRSVLGEARSVVSVGLSYWAGHRQPAEMNSGQIARYAWGDDYHRVMGERLSQFGSLLEQSAGGEHRWYVDTGPAMDRALAVRAGIGWYGKNTNVLTERFGSFILLGEIITTADIEPDAPLDRSCGACRLCVMACPTGALGPEYSLDSRKCISYLTIEHRGPIPHEYRDLMGDWVFGCDICQDVCPPAMRPYLRGAAERRAWTSNVRASLRPSGAANELQTVADSPVDARGPLFARGVRQSVDLLWLLGLSHDDYVEAFRGTSIKRAKVWMLRRNAAVALGNVGTADVIGPVSVAMTRDEHPLVRGHAAWALGRLAMRYGSQEAALALRTAQGEETDDYVRQEISLALTRCEAGALPSSA